MNTLHTSLDLLVDLLQEQVDMDLWMFTQVIENDWTIVACSANPYGINRDDVLKWNDSVCSRMVTMNGVNIVPDLSLIEDYAKAPIVSEHKILSYIGFPLYSEDEELIGSVCAISTVTKPANISNTQAKLEQIVQIAQTTLNQYDLNKRLEKTLDIFNLQSGINDTTGLPDQESFFQHAQECKERYDKISCPIGVLVIEISGMKIVNDDTGLTYNDILRAVSADIRGLMRQSDYVSKLHGSKFGVLMVNVETKYISAMVLKLFEKLSYLKLKISIGADICKPQDSIEESIGRANDNRIM